MNISLNHAPFNHPLALIHVRNSRLRLRFQHMGLYENDILTRLDEDILVQPVRIRGPKGEFILGKGMGVKIVVHLDDDRKLPIAELKPGESGHIEGIVGGSGLADALETLGLRNNDLITFIRRIPPMEYTALVNGRHRIRLNEGVAAKIWGRVEGRDLQFSSSRKNKPFQVKKILGGRKAQKIVSLHGGISPGTGLTLETVKPVDTLIVSNNDNSVIIYTNDGLRLILGQETCAGIIVRSL